MFKCGKIHCEINKDNKNENYVKIFLTNLPLSKLYEVPDGKV